MGVALFLGLMVTFPGLGGFYPILSPEEMERDSGTMGSKYPTIILKDQYHSQDYYWIS